MACGTASEPEEQAGSGQSATGQTPERAASTSQAVTGQTPERATDDNAISLKNFASVPNGEYFWIVMLDIRAFVDGDVRAAVAYATGFQADPEEGYIDPLGPRWEQEFGIS